MEITSREELGRFSATVLDAIAEGEVAYDQLTSILAQPGALDDRWNRGWWRWLWADKVRAMVALDGSRRRQAAAALAPFSHALARVPYPVTLPCLDGEPVLTGPVAASSGEWAGRLEAAADRRSALLAWQEVTTEVHSALGVLERVRTQARLSLMRLES